jgi:HEAT repeat protein
LGEAKQRLNELARALGIDQTARRMLNTRRLPARLMAVVTLGNLEERSVWAELRNLAATDNAFLSLAAARALLQVNPTMAMSVMAPLIACREDWPRTKVVNILREVGAETFAVPLVHEIAIAPAANAARLIRYLEATRCVTALPMLRDCLQRRPENDEVTAASLRLFGRLQDPGDLDTLRGFVAHPTWFVRLAAIIAIGRMGTTQDESRLIERLSDEHWWVRYRAAEALAGLPYMSPERLCQIDAAQNDPRAKEILVPFLAQGAVPARPMRSAVA